MARPLTPDPVALDLAAADSAACRPASADAAHARCLQRPHAGERRLEGGRGAAGMRLEGG